MATITRAALELSSPSFEHQSYIPARYTCEGQNINPAIRIAKIPDGTESLALIVDDPDAPGGTFNHWLVWNIEPSDLIEEDSVPGVEGRNGWGETGYRGPCPPSGTHHYHFKLYALDSKLDLKEGAERSLLDQAMMGHIVGMGALLGLYRKSK